MPSFQDYELTSYDASPATKILTSKNKRDKRQSLAGHRQSLGGQRQSIGSPHSAQRMIDKRQSISPHMAQLSMVGYDPILHVIFCILVKFSISVF